ncbi:HDOD domain-containing protein [Neiella marina]|uniref:HDOD domain-containing protein n=1 Tax=Neiella holothuriorum TaxID=2870530 RepID=A0ABS7EGK7_9GAMM|nr:HDOD domain-containing protein [Neiella holothuriorum]MBW8191339.1 HDOD domain-containing protein [Neiella holothuriorum]
MSSNTQVKMLLYAVSNERRPHVPSPPKVLLQLQRVARDEFAGFGDVVDVVSSDPGLAAQFVHAANNMQRQRRVVSIRDAVSLIGLTGTEALIIQICMDNFFVSNQQQVQTILHREWRRSRAVSQLARYLTVKFIDNADDELASRAQLASLLHNIGALPVLSKASQIFESSELLPGVLDQAIDELGYTSAVQFIDKWRLGTEVKQTVDYWHHNKPLETIESDLQCVIALACAYYDRTARQSDYLKLESRLTASGILPYAGYLDSTESPASKLMPSNKIVRSA